MRFFNKYFFAGLATGVVLTLGGLFAWGLIMYQQAQQAYENAGYSTDAVPLPPPDLPNPSRLSVLGQVDESWAFSSLSGERVTLADYRGKVVVLNLWATWCMPCLLEMPSLEALTEATDPEHVVVLAVSEEPEAVVRSFAERRAYDLSLYVDQSPRPAMFQTMAIPATFIIDPEGAVVVKHIGIADWNHDSVPRFIQALRALSQTAKLIPSH